MLPEDSSSKGQPGSLQGKKDRCSAAVAEAERTEEDSPVEDTPVEDTLAAGTLAEGTLAEDTRPSHTLLEDNLGEEELQQEAAADCSNSYLQTKEGFDSNKKKKKKESAFMRERARVEAKFGS
eukprot:TRINITY_DN518_c0_g1_i1.p2 TRINITY_DN518_c0_g1~~TRINITY_DN518_c0_g1_i1.p2  ORF type:complete len:123 (+),score=33.62 TRINITY_DN518_c0_g1_i1:512-880(+)